jgi:hypothetical protein
MGDSAYHGDKLTKRHEGDKFAGHLDVDKDWKFDNASQGQAAQDSKDFKSLHDEFIDVVSKDPNVDRKIVHPNTDNLRSYMLDERAQNGSGLVEYFYGKSGHLKLLCNYNTPTEMQFERYDDVTGNVQAIQKVEGNMANGGKETTEFFEHGKLVGKLELANEKDDKADAMVTNATVTQYDQSGKAVPGNKMPVSFDQSMDLSDLTEISRFDSVLEKLGLKRQI